MVKKKHVKWQGNNPPVKVCPALRWRLDKTTCRDSFQSKLFCVSLRAGTNHEARLEAAWLSMKDLIPL